jgi:hypothetical protein
LDDPDFDREEPLVLFDFARDFGLDVFDFELVRRFDPLRLFPPLLVFVWAIPISLRGLLPATCR